MAHVPTVRRWAECQGYADRAEPCGIDTYRVVVPCGWSRYHSKVRPAARRALTGFSRVFIVVVVLWLLFCKWLPMMLAVVGL